MPEWNLSCQGKKKVVLEELMKKEKKWRKNLYCLREQGSLSHGTGLP